MRFLAGVTFRRSLGVVGAALALVVVATLVVVRGGSPGAPAGATLDEPVAPLVWGPCTDERDRGAECAQPLVPLDHDDPFGPQVELYVTRLPATGAPEDRIGSLFINPGGPGGSGLGLLEALRPGFSTEIRERYDLVTFSPRGVIGSRPDLTCEVGSNDDAPDPRALRTAAEWHAYFELVDPTLGRDATACQVANARIGRFLSTNQVVEDLDHLRAAAGDELLRYWGISYGSRIGTVYAQRHPDRVGAMVLDGLMDPGGDWYQLLSERGGSYDRALEVYLAARPGLEDALVEVTIALREQETIPVVLDGAPHDLDIDTLLSWLHTAVPRQGRWASFEAQLLAVQTQVRGGPTAELVTSPSLASTAHMFDQISCMDTTAEVTASQAGRDAAQMVAEGPVFGWIMAEGLVGCVSFPLLPDEISTVAPPPSLPPILLVSSQHDPATPHVWAERAEAFLPGSRLLTYEGTQHGVWTRASACIDAHVDAYLLAGELPSPGTRCPFVLPDPVSPAAPAVVPGR